MDGARRDLEGRVWEGPRRTRRDNGEVDPTSDDARRGGRRAVAVRRHAVGSGQPHACASAGGKAKAGDVEEYVFLGSLLGLFLSPIKLNV